MGQYGTTVRLPPSQASYTFRLKNTLHALLHYNLSVSSCKRQFKNQAAKITLIPGTFCAASQCWQPDCNKHQANAAGRASESSNKVMKMCVTQKVNRSSRQESWSSDCLSLLLNRRCLKGPRNGRALEKIICKLSHHPLSAARTFAWSNENWVIFIIYFKAPCKGTICCRDSRGMEICWAVAVDCICTYTLQSTC